MVVIKYTIEICDGLIPTYGVVAKYSFIECTCIYFIFRISCILMI